MAQPEDQPVQRGRSQPILFDSRYEVWVDEPLGQYNAPPALAYRCVDLEHPGRHCLAMVCDPAHPPRLHQVPKFKEVQHAFIQKVYHHGIIDWTPENRRCPCLVIEKPFGDRLMASLTKSQTPMREEEVLMRVIRPAIRLLSEMRTAGVTHRAIRPTNLFWGDKSHSKVMLGECLSSPVAITQPVIFEGLEGAMCHPLGRGYGNASDDIYALAVTYFCLLTGEVPCMGMSDEEIVEARLLRGTYDLIIGTREFSRMAFEIFQGCLDDNPFTRWRQEDLAAWIGGKHYPLKARPHPRKAGQPFALGKKNYHNARHLSWGIRKDWEASRAPIVNGDLDVWVRRYIADSDLVAKLNAARFEVQGTSKTSVDRLIARVSSVLDPHGPLGFKSFIAMPDGVGILASLKARDADTQVNFLSLINSNIMAFWRQNFRYDLKHVNASLVQLESVRRDIRIMRLGHGLERFRYQLNPDLPCLSPKLESEFVIDIQGLMRAMDRVSREMPEKLSGELIDREIATFIALKQSQDFRNEFQAIESAADPDQAVIEQVRILAILQNNVVEAAEPYHDLCSACARLLSRTLTRIRSAENRAFLAERMEEASRRGYMVELLDIVDDEDAMAKDKAEFAFAQAEYRSLTDRVEELEKNLAERSDLSRIAGGHVAAGVSGVIGCVLAVVLFVWQQFF